jgi:hypothetical protein
MRIRTPMEGSARASELGAPASLPAKYPLQLAGRDAGTPGCRPAVWILEFATSLKLEV